MPQEATLSSLLLYIYMDIVLKSLVSEFYDISNVYKKAYADDTIFYPKTKASQLVTNTITSD